MSEENWKELIGNVEAVSIKGNNRFSIKIGEQWYSGFGKAPNKEDSVFIRYVITEKDGMKWHNIRELVREEDAKRFGVTPATSVQQTLESEAPQEAIEALQESELRPASEISLSAQMEMCKIKEARRIEACKIAASILKISGLPAKAETLINIATLIEEYIKN